MNIHTILSALPPSVSGAPQSGTQSGQFTLALGQAAQANSASAPALDIALPQGLPSDLTVRQALLQALQAAEHSLNEDSELVTPDAQLNEIMARLALIDASQEQKTLDDATLMPLLPTEADASRAASELADEPFAMALATTPLSVETRQPGASTSGIKGSPLPTALAQALAAASPNADLGPALSQASPEQRAPLSADSLRPTDATTLPRAGAAQNPVDSLRLAEAATLARGGAAPEATFSPSMAHTASGASPTAQAAMPSQAALAAPVQSQAWPQQLGQQLVQFARQGGEQRIEMRLNPAELGPLSVTLKMTEQGAQAQFLSAHAQIRQVLEQAIPQLRETLAEQGIMLGEASVGEQRRQDAQAFAGDQQGQSGEQSDASQAEGELALSADEALTAGAPVTLDGRVNLYA